MVRRVLSIALAAIVIGGCSSSPTMQLRNEDLQGIWVLEAFDSDGASQQIEIDVNSAGTPWIKINGTIEGSGGCNTLSMNSFDLDGNELKPGDWFTTLAACLTDDPARDPMAAEKAFHAVLNEDSITVEIAESTMTWRAAGIELSFNSADARPDR